jgi:hypothetical protein
MIDRYRPVKDPVLPDFLVDKMKTKAQMETIVNMAQE